MEIHRIKKNIKIVQEQVGLILKGFCIGMANAVPGISGGTIAFILGIYEELINAIRAFDLTFFRDLCAGRWKDSIARIPVRFLGFLLFGVMCAIVSVAKIIGWLFEDHPVLINSFFFGLILATVPIMARIVQRWTWGNMIAVFAGAGGMYLLAKVTPMTTPESFLFLVLCGAIAIATMILPGISGAFVLVLLGKYQYIISAVNERNISVLASVGVGAIIGLLSFVRILSWLFRKHHDMTMAFLTGIVVGSLDKIWPWKKIIEAVTLKNGKVVPVVVQSVLPAEIDGQILFAVLLMVIGFVLAIVLNSSGKEKVLSSP